MDNIAGIPYTEVVFDKDGTILSAPNLPGEVTDLYVISHGWNNNREDAHNLYRNFFTNFKQVAPSAMLSGRSIAILGVIWPSKRFDELVAVESSANSGGGAAGFADSGPDPDSERLLNQKVDRMKEFFTEPEQQKKLDEARGLIPNLEMKGSARARFVDLVREILDGTAADQEDASNIFFKVDPRELMQQLRIPEEDASSEVKTGGGASFTGPGAPAVEVVGGAAGVTNFLKGFKTAAMNVLNYATYFEMKKRAGVVGKNGVAPLIDQLSVQVRAIHLIGHSFGGRVVTAAAASSQNDKIRSMALLQAAFSHNGFSQSMKGFFRNVVDGRRVKGPIIVTHTKNDKAVGIAYPIASRIAGQMNAALGDEKDRFGGIGRNGAQKMNSGEVITGELLDVQANYRFVAGKFYNALADQFIKDHGDVTGPQVAYAVALASLGNT